MRNGIIYKNGVPYTGCSSRDIKVAGLSTKSIRDSDGNIISQTYLKKTDFDAGVLKNVEYRNTLYRGKNITERFNSGDVYAKIADGSFEDLFIGDYFTISYDDPVYDETKDTDGIGPEHIETIWRIAEFGVIPTYNGGSFMPTVGIVSDGNILGTKKVQWNSTDNTTVYIDSYIFDFINYNSPVYLSFKDFFGEHCLFREMQYGIFDTNVISGSGYNQMGSFYRMPAASNRPFVLLSEVEVFGSRIWASSGEECNLSHQLALFKLNPSLIASDMSYWLRTTNSLNRVCCVDSNGLPNIDIPTSNHAIRIFSILS